MDAEKFFNEVTCPAVSCLRLHNPDHPMPLRSAIQLVTATALHESGGLKHRRQINGPALSVFQIEPDTLRDLQVNWLKYRPEHVAALDALATPDVPWAEQLEANDTFAAAVCRLIYYRVSDPLPVADDLLAHAAYWKQHYNTHLGKGTPEKFIRDVHTHAPWLYPSHVFEAAGLGGADA